MPVPVAAQNDDRPLRGQDDPGIIAASITSVIGTILAALTRLLALNDRRGASFVSIRAIVVALLTVTTAASVVVPAILAFFALAAIMIAAVAVLGDGGLGQAKREDERAAQGD